MTDDELIQLLMEDDEILREIVERYFEMEKDPIWGSNFYEPEGSTVF